MMTLLRERTTDGTSSSGQAMLVLALLGFSLQQRGATGAKAVSSLRSSNSSLEVTKQVESQKRRVGDGNVLSLHHSETATDDEDDILVSTWEEHQQIFMKTIYRNELAPGTFPHDDSDEEFELLTPALLDATFIYWGLGMSDEYISSDDVTGIHASMSLWNDTQVIGPEWNSKQHSKADEISQHPLHEWTFTSDAPLVENSVDNLDDFVSHTTVLDSRYHYIVLNPLLSPTGQVSPEEDFVNYIGYLAYLRKKFQNTKTKFVVAESIEMNHQIRQMLDAFDPEFSMKQIEWIECTDVQHCNYRLKGGKSLRVLRPNVSPKHVDLMTMARTWMDDVKNKSHWWSHYDSDNTQLVLYFKPKSSVNAISMLNEDDETEMLSIMKDEFKKHNDNAKHHVQVITLEEENFSDMKFKDQMALFHRAIMVIGSNRVAPYLMFTKTSEYSRADEGKPVFLELLPKTSVYVNAVHSHYATLPWMDCHLIMMDYDKSNHEYHLNMNVVENTMKQILDTKTDSSDEEARDISALILSSEDSESVVIE